MAQVEMREKTLWNESDGSARLNLVLHFLNHRDETSAKEDIRRGRSKYWNVLGMKLTTWRKRP
jgi:hypothetical protein